MRKTSIAAALSLGLGICAAADAHADPLSKQEGYGYEFNDDRLSLPEPPAPPAPCHHRAWPRRTLLVRIRTHFVRELLQTIEKI